MLPKKFRVPAKIVVVTIATIASTADCGNQVCKEGDPTCSAGGAGGATASSTHATVASSTNASTSSEGGFIA